MAKIISERNRPWTWSKKGAFFRRDRKRWREIRLWELKEELSPTMAVPEKGQRGGNSYPPQEDLSKAVKV